MTSAAASARQRWDSSFVSVVRNSAGGAKLLLMSGVTEMGKGWTGEAFAAKELLWSGCSQLLAEVEQGCVEAEQGTDGEPALGGP